MKKKSIVSVVAVILGLLAGALLMISMGHNPIDGFMYLIQGATKSTQRIGNTIAVATPLILTGLSVAFAFKTGLFNIGAPGQMLFAGFCSLVTGLTIDLPRIPLLLLMVLVAIISGAIWASVPGILKAKFNVHEVVSSIMMNWVAYWFVYYTIQDHFKGTSETESALLGEHATLQATWLTELFKGSYINLGIFIAIIATIVIAFILNKTTLGYELKAVGYSKDAAEYAGISVNRNIIISMMIAGALSGLAGLVAYTGNATSMQIGVMPSEGFDGIAVSLLGANSPLGVVFAALFFGILYVGSGFMSTMTNIPPEIADTIMATIIYFAATSILIERFYDKIAYRFKEKKEKNLLPRDEREAK